MVAPLAAAAIPAVIGAAGSIAGGLLSRKSGNPAKQVYTGTQRQLRAQYDFAREKGLHPLAVMGNPGFQGGGGFGTGSAGLPDAANILAQGVRDYAASKADAKAEDRQAMLDQRSAALVDAQIAEVRSRTLLNQANAKRLLGGPTGGPPPLGTNGTHGGIETLDGRRVEKDPARDMPATQIVQLGKYKAYGPAAESFEVGLGELIGGGLIYAPQWLYQYLMNEGGPAIRKKLDETIKADKKRGRSGASIRW